MVPFLFHYRPKCYYGDLHRGKLEQRRTAMQQEQWKYSRREKPPRMHATSFYMLIFNISLSRLQRRTPSHYGAMHAYAFSYTLLTRDT